VHPACTGQGHGDNRYRCIRWLVGWLGPGDSCCLMKSFGLRNTS
jgi:hypothetical protein